MNTYENIRKHLKLAVERLREIIAEDKPVDEEELCEPSLQVTDLVESGEGPVIG